MLEVVAEEPVTADAEKVSGSFGILLLGADCSSDMM